MKNVQHVATMSCLLGVYTIHYHKGYKNIARVTYSGLSPSQVCDRVKRDIKDFTGLNYHSSDDVLPYKILNIYAA